MKTDIKIIGLTGKNGSGKGEAAAFFQKKGYTYFSLSDLIREELINRNKEPTRNNLIKMGNYLRKSLGADILARLVIKSVKTNAVIDSIRNPKEIKYLRKQRHFILLSINCPIAIRYDRVKKRTRDESASTLQEFVNKESEEITNQENLQQIQNCVKMADFTIINDSSLEDFHHKLEKFV